MTQRRRVRALHLVSYCTLHTYSIGCTASQRNNIVTIHHTSAVNKTSGSFCHRSLFVSHLSYTFSQLFLFLLFFLLPIPFLSYIRTRFSSVRLSAILFSSRLALQPRSPRPPIYLIFSFLPFVLVLSSSHRPFLRVSFSLLSPNQPPTRIFFLSFQPFRPVPRPSVFPSVLSVLSLSLSLALSLSLSHSCPVSTPASRKSIRVTSPVD